MARTQGAPILTISGRPRTQPGDDLQPPERERLSGRSTREENPAAGPRVLPKGDRCALALLWSIHAGALMSIAEWAFGQLLQQLDRAAERLGEVDGGVHARP